MNRSRYAIVLQVLTTCKNGANKTKIVYEGNLNFKTVNYYIKLLENGGMIDLRQGSPPIYQTTAKGENLMKSLMQVNGELAPISPMES